MAWPLALTLAAAVSIRFWQALRQRPQPGWPITLGLGITALGLWGITSILLAALVASFSRGAWLGAACGALGLLIAVAASSVRYLSRRARRLSGLAMLVFSGLLLLAQAFQLIPTSVINRLASIGGNLTFFDPGTVAITDQNFAVVERMAQLWAGWQMFLAHPLFGIGPGSYNLAYPTFASSPWFASRGHAHNFYLHLAAEAGLFGLLAYLVLLGFIIVGIIQALRHQNAAIPHALLLGSCGIIAAMAGHNLFEHLHVLHLSIQSATIWGIATALSQQSKDTNTCAIW
jgi:O-antigen ligase